MQTKKTTEFHIYVLFYFTYLALTCRCEYLPEAAWDKLNTIVVLE